MRSLTSATDSFPKQKAKTQWLKEGDQNTAYFHGVIRKTCMANKVIQIEDQFGHVCHYMGLLGSSKHIEHVRIDILSARNFCYQDHLALLKMPVTNEEIKTVFFDIPIDKSPRPNAYTSGFSREHIMGPDICDPIKDFLYTGKLLSQLNSTNITPITKCERPNCKIH
ncbi:uncharacterized protein LOC141632938 [Silene latifolia]|uniref:uncharacterized protein LOC141632938 n=1 Tax=Silene latifolia TaxID=37657 RepID=UPI003D785799